MAKGPKDWSPIPTVWLAQMESESFSWVGVGATPEEAAAALGRRWDEHALQMDAGIPKWSERFGDTPVGEYYGMWVRELQLGKGYRDNEGEDE